MSVTIPNTSLTFVQLFTIIFSGTFGLMGLIFLVVGFSFGASINRKRSQCTAYAEGTVSAMQSQFGSNGLARYIAFPSTESRCNTFPTTPAEAICSLDRA